MMGRKSVIGIAVLCALVFSALVAANASAAQRAYTCKTGRTEFSDAHCLTAGSGPFGHELIVTKSGTPETQHPTTITGTNEKTASNTTAAEVWKLAGTLSGVSVEIQCTGLHGHGTLVNEPTFTQREGTITFTGCTVTAPVGKGCVVTGGQIETKNLRGTTEGQAAGKLRVEPAPGETKFATLPIEGCNEEAPPKANYPVTGKITMNVSGATTTATHAEVTTQNELKFGGNAAGIEGAATLSRAEGTTPNITSGNAIVLT